MSNPTIETLIKQLLERQQKMDEEMIRMREYIERSNEARLKEISNLAREINLRVVTDTDGTSDRSRRPNLELTDDETEVDDKTQPSAQGNSRNTSNIVNREIANHLMAKESIRTIEILRGKDDLGVEDFIHSVKKARARCIEPELLLDLILVEKITEHAKRCLRYIKIDTYEKLYDCLRQHVSPPTTISNCRNKLQLIKQGTTESVQNYSMRFRQQLNELYYSVQSENRTPTERRIAISIEEREALRTYVLNLRREIGQIVTASDPSTLAKAQQVALDKEQWVRDANQATPRRPLLQKPNNNNIIKKEPPMSNIPLAKRAELKCTKCGKLGHTVEKCYVRNFQFDPNKRQPPRIHQTNEEEISLKEPEYIAQTEDSSIYEEDSSECETTDAYSWTQEQE